MVENSVLLEQRIYEKQCFIEKHGGPNWLPRRQAVGYPSSIQPSISIPISELESSLLSKVVGHVFFNEALKLIPHIVQWLVLTISW